MHRLRRETSRRLWYSLSIALPFAAYGVQRAEWTAHMRFIPFFPGVAAVAFLGGLGPGLVSTAVSTCLLFDSPHPPPALGLLFFLVSGVGTSLASQWAHRRLEKEAQLREVRDRILAIVAHDLRSPLSAITLTIQAFRKTGADRVRVADVIERNARRMDRIINDLLDADRLDQGHDLPLTPIENVMVDGLVNEVIEGCAERARSAGLQLVVSVPPGLKIKCDRGRVLQVLSNLIDNAIKFTPADGRISVRVVEDGMIRFEVADTGRGIPQEDIPHLFERRWSGGYSTGTGLGLYIACAVVRSHGGRIWCSSEPGRGTSFFFTLPVRCAV